MHAWYNRPVQTSLSPISEIKLDKFKCFRYILGFNCKPNQLLFLVILFIVIKGDQIMFPTYEVLLLPRYFNFSFFSDLVTRIFV